MRRIFIAAALSAASLGAMAQPYGYGPGSGMMHGYGMGGGPMMRDGDYAQIEDLGLTDEQRAKVVAIRKDSRAKMLELADKMHELRWDARKRIEAVLTDEQRAKFREQRPGRGW